MITSLSPATVETISQSRTTALYLGVPSDCGVRASFLVMSILAVSLKSCDSQVWHPFFGPLMPQQLNVNELSRFRLLLSPGWNVGDLLLLVL